MNLRSSNFRFKIGWRSSGTRVKNEFFLDLFGEVGKQHLAEIVGALGDVALSRRRCLRLHGVG